MSNVYVENQTLFVRGNCNKVDDVVIYIIIMHSRNGTVQRYWHTVVYQCSITMQT